MTEQETPIPEEELSGKPSTEGDPVEQGAKEEIAKMFDKYDNGPERVQAFKNKIASFLENRDLLEEDQAQAINQQLDQCASLEERESFIEEVFKAVKLVVSLRETKPEAFEQARRETFVRESGVTALNDLLSYGEGYTEGEDGEGDKTVHIHLAPAGVLLKKLKAEAKGLKEFKEKIKESVGEGLSRLAKIVQEDERIKKVTATSWVVACWPSIMRSLGFTVEGPIDEETREAHFADEKRPVAMATMSREKLLSEYLRE